ncbi:MAG: periplasmic heavy metal sensor [Desulfocapsa sp.]|jgi:zinc resistance-associated protein|nr:periplasmic heavy metal sensor [Desulfocapsa sp.]
MADALIKEKVVTYYYLYFRRYKMKKSLVVAALVVSMGFIGLQQASANRGMVPGQGMGGSNYSQLDAASKAKFDKFYNETQDLRKQMVMKRAEERALMHSTNPDSAKAAKLAGEIFDLSAAIQVKAEAAGVQGLMGCGACPGPGMGMGMGMGPHHGGGRGMMNNGPGGRGMMNNGPDGADTDDAPPAGSDAQ